MKYTTKAIGNKGIIFPSGELKGINSVKLSKVIESYIESGYREIIIDFRKVEYFDSSCLGSLIYSQILLKKYNIKLVLCVPHNHLERMLQDNNFDKAFEIVEAYE